MENSKNINPVGFDTPSKKDAEGKNRPVLIQQLTIRPLHRRSHDIASMLQSIRAAEATIPRRTELYDLYEDFLSTDAHLRTVYDNYILAITNKDWQYLDKNGQEVPHMTAFIDSPDFELTLKALAETRAWGYTMLEYNFYPDGTFGVYMIPRKHMRPHKGVVAFQQTGDAGINVREGIYADTVLEAGDEKDLGLLMVAAQYVIFKRGSLGDWAQFAEVFGQPLIDAVWNGFDEDQRQLLLKALDEMGSGGKIVRPEGTQLQFLQGGTNNPTGELYKGIIDVCNKEISKLFLGQTETTESSASSGYAQASVHAGTERDVDKALLKFVRRILNRRLHKMFEKQGIVEPGGSFSIKGENQEVISKKDQLDMDVRLRNELQLPISDDHFYEKYGVEKPEDYEAQKAAIAAQKAQQAMSPGFNMTLMDQLMKLRDTGFFDEPRQ